MKTYRLLLSALMLLIAWGVSAQQTLNVNGKVLNTDNLPVAGAVISVPGISESILSDEDGGFRFETANPQCKITVWAAGYYSQTIPLLKRSEVKIILLPENWNRYNEQQIFPYRREEGRNKINTATNITEKDLGENMTVEKALQGEVAGLQVIGKSGLPGEGAYMNLRGIRSLTASNTPLVVINGIPYLPNTSVSPVINAYSRGIFSAWDINNIQNITVLKGADAAIYGSMGSNGVILIETDGNSPSTDLETRISFNGQYGVNWNNQNIPLLGINEYKAYINEIGLTYYDNMADLYNKFPFLQDDPDYYYNYRYNNNTDWQDEIYKPSFITDNVFRVEGGDAIAKYDISIGYMRDGGVIDNTNSNRYHTLINTDITVSRKFDIFTTVGLAYTTNNLQEQGMKQETNPVLAAYAASPVISPYLKKYMAGTNGVTLADYNNYFYDVSNPKAIVNTLAADNKIFDVNFRVGLNYHPTDDITLTGLVGLSYNYDKEHIFIPGKTNTTILPLSDGQAENTVREGVGEVLNMFYNVYGTYKKDFGDYHKFHANAGMQMLTNRQEFDAGAGFNTASDFYQSLDKVTDGKMFSGYINMWRWMNFYAHADYTYNDQWRAALNIAVDGSSASGVDASRFGAFPSASLLWMGKNTKALANSSFISLLNIRAEYGLTGNSRFSSNYGKNYYKSSQFMTLSGIVRSGLPNTNLKWEKHVQLNVGTDLSFFRNRLDVSFDYYNTKSSDIVFAQPISSVFGTPDYYANTGKIDNDGMEISLRASLIRTKNFEWIAGGNIAIQHSKVKSLGGVTEKINNMADGSAIITRVGEKPFSFYGLQADGVFATTDEAMRANLKNNAGEIFRAGDVRYIDQNKDGVINDEDKVILGAAQPKYFGGFYTSFRYRNFMLSAEFTYSEGNKAYNAVRRTTESMDNFDNQSKAVLNRWQIEGHQTNIPRAEYGDPMKNNAFSSRWIEDASYVKLKNVTLSYTFNRKVLGLFRSGTLYISGENLATFTKYLGLDPEMAYSFEDAMQGFDYAKVVLPKSVKFGVNLKF